MRGLFIYTVCIATVLNCLAQEATTNDPNVVAREWTSNSGAKTIRDSLNALHTNALAKIDFEVQKKKRLVLGQYEKKLDAVLAAVRTKGDLDGYKLVKQESDRFRDEKTIAIDAKTTQPDLALAIAESQEQLSTINDKARGQAAEETKKYISDLRKLVKQLVIQEKIEDAGMVDDEIKLLSALIPEQMVDLNTEKKETALPRQVKEPLSWKDITGTFEGGKRLAAGVVLQGKGMVSKSSYRPPVEIEYVCKTDSSNIRISYACKEIIFNWECGMTSLRVDGGPAGGQHRAGAGKIPANQFVTIRQVVLPDTMEIYVNDELRGSWVADFSKIDSPIGIRSPILSPPPTITVKSVRIRVSASNGITDKSSVSSESALVSEVIKKTSIPNNAKEYKGHHYFVIDKPVTWTEAKLDAESKGGYLVIAKDKDELDFVASTLRDAGRPRGYPEGWVWVGAEYKNMRWQWLDGTSVDSNLWAKERKARNSSNTVLVLDTTAGLKEGNRSGVVWYMIEWDE